MDNDRSEPLRPNAHAEHSLISAILDGTFPPGSTLPGERTLAAELNVTRPTLREAVQRLARDGWLTVRQGKATVVNDFWHEGGLNVLSTLVQHGEHLPPNFVTQLLEVRLTLAPAYTREALINEPEKVAAFLQGYRKLMDTPESYANFDWRLHRHLALCSANPIYTLILNGFSDFYVQLAQRYFTAEGERRRSYQFYIDLAEAVKNRDSDRAEQVSQRAMQESIASWKRIDPQ